MSGSTDGVVDFSNWSCPLPLRNHPNIVMGHGGGGKLGADLIQHLFVPAFANNTLAALADSAVLLRCRFKVQPSEQGPVRREFQRRLKNEFDARGIEIPFPSRTVYSRQA